MGYRELIHKSDRKLSIRNSYVRILFAEFLGTFIVVAFVLGSNVQYVLGKPHIADIGYISVYIGAFVGYTMGVYVSAGVSGGHVNPAVSLALALIGKLQWRKLPLYGNAAFQALLCVHVGPTGNRQIILYLWFVLFSKQHLLGFVGFDILVCL